MTAQRVFPLPVRPSRAAARAARFGRRLNERVPRPDVGRGPQIIFAAGSCCGPASNAHAPFWISPPLGRTAASRLHGHCCRAVAPRSDELSQLPHDVRRPSGVYPWALIFLIVGGKFGGNARRAEWFEMVGVGAAKIVPTSQAGGTGAKQGPALRRARANSNMLRSFRIARNHTKTRRLNSSPPGVIAETGRSRHRHSDSGASRFTEN